MEKDNSNVFIFTTRTFDNESKTALFQNSEKIDINADTLLNKNLFLFNKLNLSIQKKRALLKDIYKDKKLLKEFLEKTDVNKDVKEHILIKLKNNNEIPDFLYNDFIEKYSKSESELPFLLAKIYEEKSIFSNRLHISKVKNCNIFGYRTLDLETQLEVLNTCDNFIYSLVSDISEYLKEKNVKDFFENRNVFLILHEKDIKFPSKTDYALTDNEKEEYLIENNPGLKEIPLKNLNVIIFQESLGKIFTILNSGNKFKDINQQILETSIEIITGKKYSAILKQIISVYEKARIKFAFTNSVNKQVFEVEISKLEKKLSKSYSNYDKVISINKDLKSTKCLNKFDALYKKLISVIDLKLN